MTTKSSHFDERKYSELADQAEQGKLTPISAPLRGADAADMGRRMILEATGASTIEEATSVALGRPRLANQGQETKTWKVRTPEALDRLVREAANRRGISVSAYIRLAAAHQVELDEISA